MGNKLKDFHLESYDERFVLMLALGYLPKDTRQRYEDVVNALKIRISRTECQPGGCEYCNADRAREESERRDAEDEYYQQKKGKDSQ